MIFTRLAFHHHHNNYSHQLHHDLTQQRVEAGPTQIATSTTRQRPSTLLHKYNPVIVMIAVHQCTLRPHDDYDNFDDNYMMVERMQGFYQILTTKKKQNINQISTTQHFNDQISTAKVP